MHFQNFIEVNINLSYKVTGIRDRKSALYYLVALLPWQYSFVHQYFGVP